MTITDPITEEAVEAANRALHARHDADDVFAGDARAAVEAAAPHIAAQARAMPAENLQIINGWLVERGAHDLDYPAGAAYGPYPDSDAEPLVKLDELPGWPGDTADLRTGIEALRDEWRRREQAEGLAATHAPLGSEERLVRVTNVHTCRAHADALDTLLREGE